MRTKNAHQIKFEKLQDSYLATRDANILGEMYFLLIDFYKNYITKYAKVRGLQFSQEYIEEKALDSAGFTVSHYLKRPNFKIKTLTSYGWFDMLHEISKTKNEEKYESFERLTEAYDNEEMSLNTIFNKED